MGSRVYNLNLFEKTTDKQWIYKDINPFMELNAEGKDIEVDYDIDAIQNAIYNLFLFDLGERIIEPEFGNSVYRLLYEPMNDLTAKKVGRVLKDIIERWEKRVVVENLLVIPMYDQNTYEVEVTYRIPTLIDGVLQFSYAVNARR